MTKRTTFYDEPISIQDMNMMQFLHLTRNALDEDNNKVFFNLLIERNKLFGSIKQFSFSLSPEYIEQMISIERKILARLEGERKKTIKDIEKISRKINTLKAYSVRFPIPSMPAFFDQTG